MKDFRNRVTTTVLIVIFAVALVVRLMTGDLGDLFVAGEALRYLWPFTLSFLLGYGAHALVEFIYDKVDNRDSGDDNA